VVASRGGAEVEIYGEAPLPKEPFRDLDTIPVLLTPGAEFTRGRIHLCHEVQLPDLQFEFRRESGSERNGTPQVGFPRLRFAVGRATGIAI